MMFSYQSSMLCDDAFARENASGLFSNLLVSVSFHLFQIYSTSHVLCVGPACKTEQPALKRQKCQVVCQQSHYSI